MAAQGLSHQLGTAREVVRRLVGLQAQDEWVAPYAIRPRLSPGAAPEPEGTVVTWLMRGTLHLVTAEDVGWLTELLGPVFAARSRPRRGQLGLTDDLLAEAVPRVVDRLPATRAELIRVAEAAGVPQGQARAHLLAYAGMTGAVCLTADGRFHRPPSDGYRPVHPLRELAMRYRVGYGPAGVEDFAVWSGLGLTRAREAFEHPTTPARTGGPRRADERPNSDAAPAGNGQPGDVAVPRVRLLGHLDPYLLGYRDRSFALDPRHAGLVQRGGGFLRPIVVVDGRVAGVWSRTWKAKRLIVTVEPFARIPRPELEAEVADLGRFLGTPASLVTG